MSTTLAPAGPALEREAALDPPVALVVVPGMLLALALTFLSPLALTVLAFVAFGVMHSVVEIRALAQRYAGTLLAGRALKTALAFVGALAFSRFLTWAGVLDLQGAWILEITLTYGLLYGALLTSDSVPRAARIAIGLMALPCAWLSFNYREWHFVGINHLHNLIPGLFLLRWVHETEGRVPKGLIALTIAWALVIPALFLSGVFSTPAIGPVVNPGVADPARFLHTFTPPRWWETPTSARFLAVFAFTQAMHYWLWLVVLPGRVGWSLSSNTHVLARATRDPRYLPMGLMVALIFGIILWNDFEGGRGSYSIIAAIHAYIEYPLLLLFLTAPRGRAALSA